jgi:hypothetical protein
MLGHFSSKKSAITAMRDTGRSNTANANTSRRTTTNETGVYAQSCTVELSVTAVGRKIRPVIIVSWGALVLVASLIFPPTIAFPRRGKCKRVAPSAAAASHSTLKRLSSFSSANVQERQKGPPPLGVATTSSIASPPFTADKGNRAGYCSIQKISSTSAIVMQRSTASRLSIARGSPLKWSDP